jgi:hypothetical protein
MEKLVACEEKGVSKRALSMIDVIKKTYEMLMKSIETLTGIDDKIEIIGSLKNYGLTLNLVL